MERERGEANTDAALGSLSIMTVEIIGNEATATAIMISSINACTWKHNQIWPIRAKFRNNEFVVIYTIARNACQISRTGPR